MSGDMPKCRATSSVDNKLTCPRPAIMHIRVGCAHEHIYTSSVCQYHAERIIRVGGTTSCDYCQEPMRLLPAVCSCGADGISCNQKAADLAEVSS